MKEVMLTCPFTGMPFKATEFADHTLLVKNPISGDMMRINYNASIKRYNIDRKLFQPVELMTVTEAANELEISRQRAHKIATDEIIPSFEIAGKRFFTKNDVLLYKGSRKVGAPFKEGNKDGARNY